VNFPQFVAAAHISTVNYNEMAKINQHNLHMTFSALNVDFSSLSPDRLNLRRPAQADVKNGYPTKNGFTAMGSCSVKTVADKHRYAAYHNKQ